MNKDFKNGLLVAGGAILLFLLYKNSEEIATKVDMTQAEKEGLFVSAMGYQGGIAPSQEMELRFQAIAKEAKAKIAELGLTKEFEEYSTKIRNNYFKRP